MSIQVALTHRTSYRYGHPVTLGPQTIRLRPAPHARTPILAYSLKIAPEPHFLNWQQDPQGNFLVRVVFPHPITHFDVTVDLLAEMATINPFDFFLEPEAETWPFGYDPVLEQELAPFRRAEAPGPLLAGLLARVPRGEQGTVSMLMDLNRMVGERVSYMVRMEPGIWTPEKTLEGGQGSCRDSAWLLVQILRNLGYAARFVSGYLIQLAADQKPVEGPEGPEADFADLHAWAEAYLPGAGWVGLDATSGLLTGEGHIPLAATPEPPSAAPISGSMSAGEVEFGFSMDVTRVRETPRATRPYSEESWRAIRAAGEAVDAQLSDGGARLTMGGQFTFVSATDREADEWNTATLGPTKQRVAGRLLRRLMPLWAPGGVVRHASGRQGPDGQPPRWELDVHWRLDGEPAWADPALLSDDDHADTATAEDATAFARILAGRLGPRFPQLADEGIRHQAEGQGGMAEAAGGEEDLIRATPAVEARGGRLHVFLPPLRSAEEWLGLCAAIEGTAAETGRRVVLEGHGPPPDPRLMRFSVTPGPGVIRVSVPPSRSWHEHVARTAQLYALAREEGLAAEKFMLDGRQAGTGGGNPVVMGAETPAESPFLCRPDLLKSLLGFWHNHPSLSFLFSGPFIGPASQYPRLDEGRPDLLQELEIAFAQVKPFAGMAPWVVDGLFRNLLAGTGGNTRRTEFSIEKLYSPDNPDGRRGLLACHAFGMPPDPRMAAAQMLLVRAAIAAFWRAPYERRLIRWGDRLHDEFMLPHFLGQDFSEVIEELRALGAPLEQHWFDPHFAFRFPLLGEASPRGVGLELRQALEPWNVLDGESHGGTEPRVDSSTERLQLRAIGFTPERYVLVVNGRALPMAPTGVAGEYVAGLRFKAREAPLALHPRLGTQAPLTFDLWDNWTGRSLGGFTYHAGHPGGRSYDRLPVNANEAEARRRARFLPFGHSPGGSPAPVAAREPGPGRTLDLRRPA